MARQLRLLDQVHVAAPCPADWEEMKGNDQVRHCSLCKLNVYNLSGMTDAEAEKLLLTHQGRLCVRYFMRPDGKVMTKDCPRGLRALRQKAVKRLAMAAAFVLTSLGCGEQGDKIKEATGLSLVCPPNKTITTPPIGGRVAVAGAIAPPSSLPKMPPPSTPKGKK